MPSYIDKENDKKLNQLEKQITKEYEKAWAGIDKTYRDYISGYDEIVNGKVVHHKGLDERIQEEEKAYKAGVYTDAQWIEWKKTQMARGERYRAMRDSMANQITQTNIIATSYINNKTPSVYAENYLYSAYEIEKDSGIAFNIYDENTLKQLALEKNHTGFRVNRVNRKKDYEWNQKKINSALMSGILQGKPIDKIANDFYAVMKSNRSAAIRNARTSFTSAQNSGRQDSYEDAVDMGIELQKEWVATEDERTRESHAALDGVVVDYDEMFPNGLMYPADPQGAPAEVYNCRCTMIAVVPKYQSDDRTNNTVESYKKWKNKRK